MMCTNIASYYGQDIKEESRVRPVTNGWIEKSRREREWKFYQQSVSRLHLSVIFLGVNE